jgi:hypothetical protein
VVSRKHPAVLRKKALPADVRGQDEESLTKLLLEKYDEFPKETTS